MAVVIYLGEEKRVERAHKEEVEEEGKCYENDVEMKGDDCAASFASSRVLYSLTKEHSRA